MAIDCSNAKEKIRMHYVELSGVRISSILGLPYSKEVLTLPEKKTIEKTRNLEKDKMTYFLDEILIPSLEKDVIVKYSKFVCVLENSDDQDMKSMAEKIGNKYRMVDSYSLGPDNTKQF